MALMEELFPCVHLKGNFPKWKKYFDPCPPLLPFNHFPWNTIWNVSLHHQERRVRTCPGVLQCFHTAPQNRLSVCIWQAIANCSWNIPPPHTHMTHTHRMTICIECHVIPKSQNSDIDWASFEEAGKQYFPLPATGSDCARFMCYVHQLGALGGGGGGGGGKEEREGERAADGQWERSPGYLWSCSPYWASHCRAAPACSSARSCCSWAGCRESWRPSVRSDSCLETRPACGEEHSIRTDHACPQWPVPASCLTMHLCKGWGFYVSYFLKIIYFLEREAELYS